MSHTAVYIRVSSSRQKTDSQKAEMTVWLKRHRSAKVQWFEDPALLSDISRPDAIPGS